MYFPKLHSLLLFLKSGTTSAREINGVTGMVYHSGFRQRKRTSSLPIFRDLLQGLGLNNYRGWIGKSKIHRAGHQEGRTGPLGHKLKLLSTGRISSLGKPRLSFVGFQLIGSAPPRLWKITFLT